ncbi:MAG: DUF3887 domain-containing protein [Synechococcaceae cyanobacterium]|nr:DUF3887 domain-containing protein [Synechococcaceae cyanobacterium]
MGRSDRPFMLRFRLPGPVPALLVAATLAAAAALPALAQQRPATPVQAQPAGAPSTSALSEVRARQAAERILRVLQSRDANARFAQFAPELQRVSSPSMIAETMKTQPQLLSWTITSVQPGYDSSAVEATLRTSRGPRQLLMVINADGKLTGYHFDATDAPAEAVVRDFINALSRGHFISASSFLSPTLQEEITQSALQGKWLRLQRVTGNFVAIRRVARAENTPEVKLVIATIAFNRLTDNLFVILDDRNQIIGVDFPTEPNAPAPAR